MGTGVYETTPYRTKLLEARPCECGLPHGLTYQKCRYCGAGWPEEKQLWRYAVRHYICSACRDARLKLS